MHPLDYKLLLEMETFNGIFAKSAIEKERLAQLEKDNLAVSTQDPPREDVRILSPVRYHLTATGRAAVANFKLEK